MEDEHRGYHAEDVRQAGEGVCLRKGVMAEDIHPQQSRGGESDAASEEIPIGKRTEGIGPRPCESRLRLHRYFEQHLSCAKADSLDDGEKD